MKIKIKKIMYNLGIGSSVIAIILLIALIAKKADVKMDNYMVIGDTIGDNYHAYDLYTQMDKDTIVTYNTTFTSKNLSTTNMLKIVDENAKKQLDGKSVSIKDVILKSNYICYVVGNSDLSSKIKIDKANRKATFDVDVLNRQINISGNNVYNIVDTMIEYNKYSTILLVGAYMPYIDLETEQIEIIDEIFSGYNETLKQIAIDTNVNFIDISSLSDDEYLHISDYTINRKGSEYISDRIYSCVINKKCN